MGTSDKLHWESAWKLHYIRTKDHIDFNVWIESIILTENTDYLDELVAEIKKFQLHKKYLDGIGELIYLSKYSISPRLIPTEPSNCPNVGGEYIEINGVKIYKSLLNEEFNQIYKILNRSLDKINHYYLATQ